MDQIMLGILVDDSAVGIYAAAARISEVWYFIPVAIVTSFFPALINAKSSDTSLYQNDLQRLNDLLFVSALVIAFGVSLTASWGIEKLFGITYAEAASVLIVHTWVGIFVFMRVLLSKWFITENLLKLSMFSQVLGALANIFLNVQLIPLYGPIGAAYATVISFSVAGYLVLFLHRDLWPMALVVTRSLLLPLRLLQKGRNLYSS
jgi:PST family polysaccharide transporter